MYDNYHSVVGHRYQRNGEYNATGRVVELGFKRNANNLRESAKGGFEPVLRESIKRLVLLRRLCFVDGLIQTPLD